MHWYENRFNASNKAGSKEKKISLSILQGIFRF